MPSLVHLTALDPDYPSRLRGVEQAPASLTVGGGSVEASKVVAIVGSRDATEPAALFARELARAAADAGIVVVSGGAVGIDAAAHQGALDAGGRTWVVAGTGHLHCFPPENSALFDTIGAGPSAMIWPFAPDRPANARPSGFLIRNRWLVALSDAVIVVQAGPRSGALSAANCALSQRKPLWVVPDSPWSKGPLHGIRDLLDRRLARPLTSTGCFLEWMALSEAERAAHLWAAPRRRSSSRKASNSNEVRPVALLARAPLELSDHESAVLQATSTGAQHADAITTKAGLSPQATAAALLTLALENVLVEGPPGFFRRRDAHNA